MLLETFSLDWDPSRTQLALGLGLGLLFGVAAQISRFCLRSALVGDKATRGPALGVWLIAFAMAMVSFQVLHGAGLVDLSSNRFLTTNVPVLAIAIGGLAFGAGMVLTRGCVSRLTVLGATGNLRAIFVLLTFAVVAHATLKGVFSGLRVSLGDVTVATPVATLGELLGNAYLAAGLIVVVAATVIWRLRPPLISALSAGLIGILAAVGWSATSVLLLDEFDPAPVQSLAFTLPWSDGLFWAIASTAIPAGFGVGLIGGVLAGAFLSAAARGELALQSFETPAQSLRYLSGGALMGFGGVLAGGCTVGAGLSGTSTLSFSAFLALGAIIVGARLTNRLLIPTDKAIGQTATAI